MTPPERSDSAPNRAFRRAAADIDRDTDKQADARRLIQQIANVTMVRVANDDDTIYLVADGAHDADFRIAIAITPAGRIGWSLV